jgi:hypothetical protein
MKVGDKYIIEIEEVIRRNGAPQIARVKGFNTLVFDKYGLEKLEPYDGEKVYLKGYENGYKNGKNAVMNESEEKHNSDLDYKDGLEDGRMEAWECARKIVEMSEYDRKWNVFTKCDDGEYPFVKYTASEAIAKIKEYEQKQTDTKEGHWNVVSDGYGDSAYICECSECKDTVWVYKDADRKWNYCPNCGAKMESEG